MLPEFRKEESLGKEDRFAKYLRGGTLALLNEEGEQNNPQRNEVGDDLPF